MQLSADEISSIIKKQIQNFDRTSQVSETGTVLSCGDGIARIYGLEGAMAGELVEFANGTSALVLNLEQDNVGVAVLGEASSVREGDSVKRTGRIADVPVGDALSGRVVNALGQPIDGSVRGRLTEIERQLVGQARSAALPPPLRFPPTQPQQIQRPTPCSLAPTKFHRSSRSRSRTSTAPPR